MSKWIHDMLSADWACLQTKSLLVVYNTVVKGRRATILCCDVMPACLPGLTCKRGWQPRLTFVILSQAALQLARVDTVEMPPNPLPAAVVYSESGNNAAPTSSLNCCSDGTHSSSRVAPATSVIPDTVTGSTGSRFARKVKVVLGHVSQLPALPHASPE